MVKVCLLYSYNVLENLLSFLVFNSLVFKFLLAVNNEDDAPKRWKAVTKAG